ncbi:N-acetyltransferase [Flavobacterium sp. Sd200]|uniref:GNAT family N-acetyltransferase n=1 Tax=Flavobacterium sp. Sd200 TaxID=2692211 RepID=UPI00136AC027|nr:GNAT family N-acetyltransferase [Flavobacterium sp. Sd200]MXN92275.1 N-acetyltransferase [Flavobacterium sp. Sd200]
MATETFKINEEENQFELHTQGGIAFLEFIREGEKIYLTHTETPVALRGRGIAASLVKQTLQCAKDNGLTVVPSCSYVAHYVNNHPEWNIILSDGYQM